MDGTLMLDVTKSQLRMMRHAIGIAKAGGWMNGEFVARNHYCAGQSQFPEWDELVASGLAVAVTRSACGLSTFSLTERGIARARRA